MPKIEDDVHWMKHALGLARRGQGRTSPNPMVGALLVEQNRMIGSGWHQKAGEAHAEVLAIRSASMADLKHATLYVTLEPCSTFGKTPPCVDAIIQTGIRRVVVGTVDPNPLHRGRGLRKLRRSGIQVESGILQEACRDLNRAWNHWITTGMPWVIAKCGMTLDGKIATSTGQSQWLTSIAARRDAHRLRSRVDAILVGIQTILNDDPTLNVRHVSLAGRKQPQIVIADSRLRIPLNSKALSHAPCWIFTSRKSPVSKRLQLEKQGHQVTVLNRNRQGLPLHALLRHLGKRKITSLLVEGGGKMLGSIMDQRLAHELHFYLAPCILGDKRSIRAVEGLGVRTWSQGIRLDSMRIRRVGMDLKISALCSQLQKKSLSKT